jgi:MFS family permease
MARVLSLVLVYFTAEAVFQTLLPVSLKAAGASGLVIGAFLACSQGIGIVGMPPAAAWGDAHGRAPILRLGGGITALCMLAMAGAVWSGSLAAWIVPLIVYGCARSSTVTTILAVVSGTGDPLRMQGFNSAAQRGAAAAGAVITAVLLARQAYGWGFAAMAGTGCYAAWSAGRVAPRPAASPAARPGPPAAAGRLRDSYRTSLSMLRRERSLQASSLINISALVTTLVGNAFYPLALTLPPERLAIWVLVLLLCRDVTSVLLGPWFRPIARRVGLINVLVAMAVLSTGGILLVAAGGASLPVIAAAAVLQGASQCFAIGSTNLLATQSAPGRVGAQAGRGLRLTATNYGNSVVALILPAALGALFDARGSRAVFLVAAGVTGAATAGAVLLARASERGLPIRLDLQAPGHGDDERPDVGPDLDADDAGDRPDPSAEGPELAVRAAADLG